MTQDDNPFIVTDVEENIKKELAKEGFTYNEEYVIIIVPNIVDISYGRGVGYTFTEHDLGKDIHDISATKIREEMREEGKLPTTKDIMKYTEGTRMDDAYYFFDPEKNNVR